MRILKITALCVILLAAYSAGWYYLADSRQKKIDRWIEELKNSHDVYLSYAKIEKGGFPFNTSFTVTNPKITSKLLKVESEGQIELAFSLTGALQESHGHIRSVIGTQNGLLQGALSTNLQLAKSAGGKTSLSLHKTNLSLALEGKPLIENFSLDETSLVVQKVEATNTYGFRMGVDGIQYDFEKLVPTEGLVGYQQYMNQELANRLKNAKGVLDFELTLPPGLPLERIAELPWLFLGTSVPTCTLKLNEFTVTSNFVTEKSFGHISIGEKDDVVSLSGSINAMTQFSQEYYEALKEITKTYITEFHPNHEKLNFDMLLPIIPKFQDFGAITFKKEGQFELNKSTWRIHASVPTLEVATDLYSIGLSFDASNMKGSGEVTCQLHIHNFRRLINDLISYFNSFTKVFNVIRDETMYRLEPANEATKNAIFGFFDLFTKDPNANDVAIDFKYNDGECTYGKFTQEEFTVIATTTLQRILEQVMPESVPSKEPQKQ